jgi:ABC-type Mn2+/Zn2+ transport system ATPase subunit
MTDPAVIADSLTLGYERRVTFGDSTFSIPSRAVTVIIGPNGSGKSTVLKAIAGLIEPLSGTLHVNVPTDRVALVLQSTSVNERLPMSVHEVVSMGRYSTVGYFGRPSRDDRLAIESAMEQAGVAKLASKQLHVLSGGQRQRVFVAQGLAQEHELLLLDEPFTGIDLPTAQAIDEMVYEERNQGRTIVISTHDLTEAQHADYVLLLSGRLVAEGPPEDVITPDNLMTAYGSSVLHPNREGVFVDDPAHRQESERHFH